MSSIRPSSFVLRLFTDQSVRALLAPALVFIACCIDQNYQTDLWHHLARGRVMAEEGRLLDEDRFTYTVPGKPFQDVNWLSQLAFYRIWQLGGLPLLQTVNALVLAGMMGLLVGLSRRMSGSMLAAGGACAFVFLGLWQLFLIRPQTFSMLLFVSLYACLEGAERKRWLLLLAPVHLALWVNLHGAFPIGLVLVGCYGLAAGIEGLWLRKWQVFRDRHVWQLAACLTASLLATLVNPYGWRVWEYVRLTSGMAAARKIDEWLPPGLDTLTGKVWAASLVALLVLLALPGRRPSVRQTVLLAAAPVLAFLAADRLQRETASSAEDKPNLGAALSAAGLLAAMLLSLPWFENWSPYRFVKPTHRLEDDLEAAAQRIRQEVPRGRIFTRFEWGEYLTWSLGPNYPVFMDGRIEIFPDEVWDDYARITSGSADWDSLLRDKYGVEFLLIDQGPYHGRLRPLAEKESHGWEQVGEAEGAIQVYRRAAKK